MHITNTIIILNDSWFNDKIVSGCKDIQFLGYRVFTDVK